MRWVTDVQSLKGVSGKEMYLYKISEWKPVQLRLLGVPLHRLGLNCNYGLVLWAGEGGPKIKHH